MSGRVASTLVLALVLAAGGDVRAQESQLLDAYKAIDEAAAREGAGDREKLELLSGTLDAADASMDLVDGMVESVERAAVVGALFDPDHAAVERLQALGSRLREAQEAVGERWPVKALGALNAARGYKESLDDALAEIDGFRRDKELPPDAAEALLALRGLGAVLSAAGDVPVAGDAIAQYGEILSTLSHTVRDGYRNIAPGGKEGALLNSFSNRLLEGFPGDALPTQTPVLAETSWKIPLVRNGNDGHCYLRVGERWEEVDEADVTAVVSDWLVVHYRPQSDLLEKAFEAPGMIRMAAVGGAEAVDDTYPTPDELLALVREPGRRAFGTGFSRKELRAQAAERLALMAAHRQMTDVLSGVEAFEAGQIGVEQFRQAKKWLRENTPALGVPLSPRREGALLRDFFVDAKRVDSALRTSALRLQPGAEDFVRGLGRDPLTLPLSDLGQLLREYRNGRAWVPVVVRVVDGGTGSGVAGARVRLARLSPPDAAEVSGSSWREAVSDKAGRAELLVLRGYHRAEVKADGYEGPEPAPRLQLAEPGPHSVTLRLEPARGAVVATVVDAEGGAAVAGARVSLRQGADVREATSGADGVARLEGVPFGRWTMEAAAEGYRTASWDGLVLAPTDKERSGTIRLRHEPAPAPPPAAAPSSPSPPAGPRACGVQLLGDWNGTVTESVLPGVSEAETAPSPYTHAFDVPGPGRLRVTLGAGGEHEFSVHQYGSERFHATARLASAPGVVGNGLVRGGSYNSTYHDYGESGRSFAVKGPGAVTVTVSPESCWTRQLRGRQVCWVTGDRKTGLKFLPGRYRLKVEFDPCP